MNKRKRSQHTTSGLAQAGGEVFWLEGSAVNPPAFAKPRGVVGNAGDSAAGQ